MSKVKIFLGAYLDIINAQNLNCRHIAKYLDKNQFKVYSLSIKKQKKIKNTIVLRIFFNYKIFKRLGFLWGVLKCDVIYLPKYTTDCPIWLVKFAKILNKKVFSTIEIDITDDQNLNRYLSFYRDSKHMLYHFSLLDKLFPITDFLYKRTKHFGFNVIDKVLRLGVDSDFFRNERQIDGDLKNIAFIGSIKARKNVSKILDLANCFKNINFHIIGNGPDYGHILDKSKEMNLGNVEFHGELEQNKLSSLLLKIDLHVLLSRSEGFPKVILEAASFGIPSVVYSDYGADKFIPKNKGFVVKSFDDVKEVISDLYNRPALLKEISLNTKELSADYNWKTIIKDWEYEIINLVK